MRLGERRPCRTATAACIGSAVLCRLCAAPRDGDIDEKDMTAADVSTDYLCAQPMAGIR